MTLNCVRSDMQEFLTKYRFIIYVYDGNQLCKNDNIEKKIFEYECDKSISLEQCKFINRYAKLHLHYIRMLMALNCRAAILYYYYCALLLFNTSVLQI